MPEDSLEAAGKGLPPPNNPPKEFPGEESARSSAALHRPDCLRRGAELVAFPLRK
jgi:hypothetical protein